VILGHGTYQCRSFVPFGPLGILLLVLAGGAVYQILSDLNGGKLRYLATTRKVPREVFIINKLFLLQTEIAVRLVLGKLIVLAAKEELFELFFVLFLSPQIEVHIHLPRRRFLNRPRGP
jgi:hypothetical protein